MAYVIGFLGVALMVFSIIMVAVSLIEIIRTIMKNIKL